MVDPRQRDDAELTRRLARWSDRELLRLLTCGSVDAGKSTLIGRLLHDADAVHEDVLRATERATQRSGTTDAPLDFALLVDGLESEREQGITIDVAYRCFGTARRQFVLADTPGHVQYTRNMVTGASNSDLAVILIDARLGVLEQTRRHSFLCSLLGIRHFVIAINKMDLVGFREERFREIRAEYAAFAARLQVHDIRFVPMAALGGDNVVHRSTNMPWYQDAPLLALLETVHVASDENLVDLRFPVQNVVRAQPDFRGYAGTIASGVLRVGDPVAVLPSGVRSTVRSIVTFDGPLDEAPAGRAITVTLADELDVGRGDMIVAPNNAPSLDNTIEAMVVWFDGSPLTAGGQFLLKHTTRQTTATVTDLRYRIDVTSLRRQPAGSLAMNEVGRVRIQCSHPLAADAYQHNRGTGAFLLIDRATNATAAAGMIVERKTVDEATQRRRASADAGQNVRIATKRQVTPEQRRARLGQEPFVLWITGLPRAGKSSLAYGVEKWLFDHGHHVQVLDGEVLRLSINRDLGFSGADRWENQRRAAELARLQADLGISTIVALVAPLAFERQKAREIVGANAFFEIFCDAPLAACEARDRDGLYASARAGEIVGVTGIDAPYEAPQNPDLRVDTVRDSEATNVAKVIDLLRSRHLLR